MKNFILIFIIGIASGCVSVSLPKTTGEKAEGVELALPQSPYNEIKSASADRAWISEKTGNTISYLSDCNNPVDPTLQQVENESLAVLSDLQVETTKNILFNGRQGLETVAGGTVDGVLVKMKIITFKKNRCTYSIIYGGVHQNFDSETKLFDQFLRSFKAP